MTFEKFDNFFEELIDDCRRMRTTKGKEYAGPKDRFDNFNRLAQKLDLPRTKVCSVYMTKHFDAIDSFVRDGEIHSTESIRGRIVDAITYLTLLAGMIEENELLAIKPAQSNL